MLSAAECCHNTLDATKGRQLPMHIGSPSLHCQYVKSNLGQQVPAANGAAYAMKLMNKSKCAITYFGEGCASEGDIPSALNIAAARGDTAEMRPRCGRDMAEIQPRYSRDTAETSPPRSTSRLPLSGFTAEGGELIVGWWLISSRW